MIRRAQKIDCRAFVGEKYFNFFRNRLFQQNQLSGLTPKTSGLSLNMLPQKRISNETGRKV